ncbi:hypothetical protein CSKR_201509 [Clonorchis sinensis]|uniref:Uncharacterized protein n=1 Tax=Clonorchis sinensis TaxID=79923 RepID=A0A8T1MSL7_CLOSI|nr:hypothetical protein CSKR_201509 [Clonorchis sinensis]
MSCVLLSLHQLSGPAVQPLSYEFRSTFLLCFEPATYVYAAGNIVNSLHERYAVLHLSQALRVQRSFEFAQHTLSTHFREISHVYVPCSVMPVGAQILTVMPPPVSIQLYSIDYQSQHL